jgi:hypothetical protein
VAHIIKLGAIMGSNFAIDLAGQDSLTLDQKVALHLQVNHYPPVPLIMVQPCVDAIFAVNDWRADEIIDLPEGVFYKGKTSAPAWAIVEQHHLDAWVHDEE